MQFTAAAEFFFIYMTVILRLNNTIRIYFQHIQLEVCRHKRQNHKLFKS